MFAQDGALDDERLRILRECSAALVIVAGELEGASRTYFEALSSLVRGVLEIIDNAVECFSWVRIKRFAITIGSVYRRSVRRRRGVGGLLRRSRRMCRGEWRGRCPR